MMSKLDFPLSGSSVNIVKQCGGALSDIINIKFGCVATFDGVDFETGASSAPWRKPPINPEKRCEFTLHGGVKVSVWKGDLTNFQADAVVNAANERLQHHGGLAQALSAAGGPQIQRECDDFIRKSGLLNTGDAVVSGAGNLQCKFIIHAVGPDLPMHPHPNDVQRARPLLAKAIYSIFDSAEAYKAANVAIPAISSGLFHYPMPDCADTIVSTVKHIYENNSPQRNLPREVLFVNNDEPTVREMVQACHQILSPHRSKTYSQAASGYTWAASNPPSPVRMQFGSVLLTLKTDRIEEQNTDVIVNTASSHGDLNVGQISTAILHKAGHKMQDEVRNAKKKDSYQRIICTKPYKLRCKEVFHTFCTDKWADPAAPSVLFNSVLECLWSAAARNHKSISFPAIGTGALGFSKTESAGIMLNAVADFTQKYPQELEVFFVIFPSDHETFQAFQSQMAFYQHPNFTPANDFQAAGGQMGSWQQTSRHNSAPAAVEAPVNRTSKPQISLRGPSEASTREADKWLSVLLNEPRLPIQIVNNFLLHFTEQDHLTLSPFHQKGVDVEEFVAQGHACLTLGGKSKEDAVVAALKVEEMLCKVQKEFVLEEKHLLKQLSDVEVSSERQPVDLFDPKFTERKRAFKHQGLWVEEVDRVSNPSLQVLFDMKKQQLGCSTSQRMFQRIPAQFCDMVSHVGFHAQCAPPEDPKYGQGIYFAGTVKKALELWKENHEEFLYFVEAEVLTGKSVLGQPGLILPPPTGQDPNDTYDSVDGGPDVSVIFSGYQAVPKYIFICKKTTLV
ncbi:protein mono-ADP-ribosyltransferase PARP9 [Nematolebias whitei]|uniref:protein mono-ADP-ribosyltransferase PARP9 n=1 Tax=Nematolebias whitei TaxID=451745 RepID=UPI001898F09C|nr:protein mono-ADP-ribosyltransferase PARP9 [Nematolebias whitei]